MLEPKKTIKLFYGGVVNIGRNMNIFSQKIKPFVNIKEMASADVRLVDLECVIATKGEQNFLDGHNYFRARPEQTNILVNNKIDIVLTANDHSSDYGAEALLEQGKYLDAAGILHAGSGKNFEEAFAPVYKKVGDVVLAVFSIDTRVEKSAATADRSGTAYLPADNLELWKKTFAERINAAHEKADVVIIAPHWGRHLAKKTIEETQKLGHLLIDLGADAVLGCHSYLVHGVEIYKERPIIYDAGSLLVDAGRRNGGCFVLEISSDGVEKVNFVPLVVRPGETLRAINSAKAINKEFTAACADFKTPLKPSKGNIIGITLNPPPRQSKIISDIADVAQEKKLIAPADDSKSDWIVDKVPDEAIIPPQRLGNLKLVGYYVPPDCRTLTQRKLLRVETYWTIDEPTDKNYLLSITAKPERECYVSPYGQGQEHEFCDYMCPTNRWKAGFIYREKFGLIPPGNDKLANLPIRVEVKVLDGEEVIGRFKAPDLVKLKLPGLPYPYWNTEFDEIIHHSEPGKCWTAEQLEKATRGKWIVAPPKDFYVQSLPMVGSPTLSAPRLFLVPGSQSRDYLLKNIEKFAGAMVTSAIPGLPPDFPQLKVRSISNASRELGFAARQRFQGKVISVTGSAGKTTTCHMLSHVLGKDHNIMASWGSSNMYGVVPRIFAHVKQDDAYAIIELSIDAFERLPGSISYEITPNVAVVTSIAPVHIRNLSSLEEIARRKSQIFCGMTKGSYAVLNRDMPYYELFEKKAKSFKLNIITFGTHSDATIRMPILENNRKFFIGDKIYTLSCPVPAEQLYDALAAVGVSLAVGFSIEKTLEYLQDFAVVRGRGNFVKVNHGGKNLTIIDSTFNANPVSIKYALEYLSSIEPNKKARVAILGDVLQLGKQSVELHKSIAEPMIKAETDRLLLCGKFMRHPYEMIKDKVNVIYFETLDELIKNVEAHLQDGDTVLIKSSHDTGLAKVVDMLSKSTAPPPPVTPPAPALNIPKALFDVKDFLPEGITPEDNGKLPADKLKRIHCGGHLYIDAARAWLAMVRAAAQENIFLNLNNPFNAYRKIESQIAVFHKRFVEVEEQSPLPDGAIRVEYDGKFWQLNPKMAYAAIPGTSSHGYGLAVDVGNIGNANVKAWLDKNAASFGFVKEYDFESWHYTYIKSREGIPPRVLEIESLPPEQTYSAELIEKASGCKWLTPPPEGWSCNGMFFAHPLKTGALAVINQGEGVGISPEVAGKIFRQMAGFICTNPVPLLPFKRPILVTSNPKETIKKLSALFSKIDGLGE